MRTLEVVAAVGMPLSIILVAGWKLVVRLRMEQQGRVSQAIVTSVRNWTDSLDGIKHQTVSYQILLGDNYYSASTNVPLRGKGYAVGDRIAVIYLPSRPDRSQPVSGGAGTSVGLCAFVIAATAALMLWMLWILNL